MPSRPDGISCCSPPAARRWPCPGANTASSPASEVRHLGLFLLSPLFIGLFASPAGLPDTPYLLPGLLAAFLAR